MGVCAQVIRVNIKYPIKWVLLKWGFVAAMSYDVWVQFSSIENAFDSSLQHFFFAVFTSNMSFINRARFWELTENNWHVANMTEVLIKLKVDEDPKHKTSVALHELFVDSNGRRF